MTPPPPAGTATFTPEQVLPPRAEAPAVGRPGAGRNGGNGPAELAVVGAVAADAVIPLWAGALADSRLRPFLYESGKRLVDVLGAVILMVVLAPVMLAVAALVALSSSGPILFRQTRVGRNGHSFIMLKFRTMVNGAEAMKAGLAHLNESGGILFKIRNDPRMTEVGRILRRTSVDELPQLWNVLVGDMSLVGPRPPVPEEVAKYRRFISRRLAVKPGMTGLCQVSGRSTLDCLRAFALDAWYVENRNFALDTTILLLTIPAVLSRKGAS